MIKHMKSILLIIVILIFQVEAQDSVPLRSDILFEVSADSLLRSNSPQDINLSIVCESSDDIESYIVKLNDAEVLWTVVSAGFNGQPLWLIMDEGKSERNNILAWQYDKVEKVLRLYPPAVSNSYELNLLVRVNLLRSNTIKKMSEQEVVLHAQSGGALSRCTTQGTGSRVAFK